MRSRVWMFLSTFTYGNAHLALVDDEDCAFLFFVDYAVFHAGAAYAFKESNVSHFVAGDFYASCQFFSSIFYFRLLLNYFENI
jgi:hypothetical protein